MSEARQKQHVDLDEPYIAALTSDPPSSSTLTSQSVSLKRRRLQFGPEATIQFKVYYAANILKFQYCYPIEERIANIYDASWVLNEAQATINTCSPEVLDQHGLKTLQRSLAAATKPDPDLENAIRGRLRYYRMEPSWASSKFLVERWGVTAETFLKHAAFLEDQFAIKKDVRATYNSFRKIYNDRIQRVADTSPVGSYQDDNDLTPGSDAEIPRFIRMAVGLMGGEKSPSSETVKKRFHKLYTIYEALYDLPEDDLSCPDHGFDLRELANAFRVVNQELVYLLADFDAEASLKDKYVVKTLDVLCQGFCRALVARSSSSISSSLARRLQKLQAQVAANPIMSHEHEFYTLALLMSSLSMRTPVGVADEEWVKYAPCMLTRAQSLNLMNQLQYLHTSFQDRAYGSDEKSRLWLAVWRGLKSLYLIVRENGFKFPPAAVPHFPLGVLFFAQTTIRNQFELALSGPEALHPTILENIVAEYCICVAQRLGDKHGADGLVPRHKQQVTADTLHHVHELWSTRSISSLALRGIQQCAARLNEILNGPAFARRIDRRGPESVLFTTEWGIDKVNPNMGSISSAQTSSEAVIQENPFDDARVGKDTVYAEDSVDPRDSQLPRTHIVSAFDYVVYPFPETRAIEVAQSRQISREMSQPGFESHGALVEDVINQPPRHTWPPGTVSLWAEPLPIGPVTVLKHAWKTWKSGPVERRQLTQARPHPTITPRRPRKEWADEHPRLRPLRDRNARISKAMQKVDYDQHQRQHHPNRMPRAEDGGLLMDNAAGKSNPIATTPESGDGVQLSSATKIERTQQLIDRVTGFWRAGDLPSTHLVRAHFLVPNDWNVDLAYNGVRNFVNYGYLKSPISTDKTQHNDSQGQAQTAAHRDIVTPNTDVFIELGVTRSLGLRPDAYGIPVYRGEAISTDVSQRHTVSQANATAHPQRRMEVRRESRLDPILKANFEPSITAQAAQLDPSDVADARVSIDLRGERETPRSETPIPNTRQLTPTKKGRSPAPSRPPRQRSAATFKHTQGEKRSRNRNRNGEDGDDNETDVKSGDAEGTVPSQSATARSASSVTVGGHRLRNRTRLAQQRAAQAARD